MEVDSCLSTGGSTDYWEFWICFPPSSLSIQRLDTHRVRQDRTRPAVEVINEQSKLWSKLIQKMSCPVAYATVTSTLPSKPYILSITPSPSNPHLILRHPSSTLTLVDNQSLQPIDEFRGGHDGNIMDVKADGGAVWSGGKDAAVVRWDERSRSAATKIKGG